MGDNSAENKLSREVILPQKPSSGVGVMVVAATAMFFAVASSAFVLRARMARRASCSSHATGHSVRLVTPVRPLVLPSANQTATDRVLVPNADCGKALYGTDRNGKASVYFTVCPPSSNKAGFVAVDADEKPGETRRVRKILGGVQVHRVVR